MCSRWVEHTLDLRESQHVQVSAVVTLRAVTAGG